MTSPARYTSMQVVEAAKLPLPRRRVLMTIDAVGGVWRYAMDMASALADRGFEFVFTGLGPKPSAGQMREAEKLGELVWLDAPLDWTTSDERPLDAIPTLLAELVTERQVDLLHLNLPSQAAGLALPVPVIAVAHSCVVTWFAAVKGTPVPQDWLWQKRRNRAGFDAADMVLAPSEALARMLRENYGPIGNLSVVHNGSRPMPGAFDKSEFAFAAGRWWDEGKNGAVLDDAASSAAWRVVMAGANQGPNGQYLEIRNADFRGELPHAQARALMGRAGIAVSPSLYEPFGLVPLEAAGAGAALVLADIATYRELWDGVALFAEPRDPQAFAHAINQLAADPVLRKDFGGRAFERSGKYTLLAQAEAMAGIYESLWLPGSALRRA
jgi:glycosyltransferase involved in cell wall biosynthesis